MKGILFYPAASGMILDVYLKTLFWYQSIFELTKVTSFSFIISKNQTILSAIMSSSLWIWFTMQKKREL